jgi:hypothetical protein
MGCNCGRRRTEAITSNVANAMIAEARQQTEEEQMAALVASASNAIGNANSTDFTAPVSEPSPA